MIRGINQKDFEYFQHIITNTNMPDYELDICESIGSNPSNTIGYFKGENVIGMVETRETELGLEISLLFVLPEHRNKQAGKLLIEYIKKHFVFNVVYAHPYTVEAEKFFVSNDFEVDLEFDINDENTVIFKRNVDVKAS
ncbi:GNAT family N-acetyltransferase [Priestia aryabhattai]